MSVTLGFVSAQDIICYHCNEEFKDSQMRQYQVLIEPETSKIISITAIHVQICLPQAEEKQAMAKIARVHLPDRHRVKNFQDLEHKFPFIAKLTNAYAEGTNTTIWSTGSSMNNGYVLEFPISLGNVPIVKDLFKFQQFKSFFTAVHVTEIELDGIKALDYPAQLKKALQSSFSDVTLFAWIHQVIGTNNCFRVITAIQANETALVDVYQHSALFSVWPNTIIDPQNNKIKKLLEPIKQALTMLQTKLQSAATVLQLTPTFQFAGVKCLDVSETVQFKGVFHHTYNVQQCEKEIYVVPRLENIISDQKTPVICFSGNNLNEYFPIFYDTTLVSEIEKELTQAKLTKQPLTNYQSLLAYFPRALNRPS